LVSEKILRKLLERLERALKRLDSKKEVPLNVFSENWEIHGSVIREFQVAIQSIIDIGTHLIAEFGWESPQTYRDVAEILVKRRVISKDYGETLKKIIAFRNILVHEYLDLDLEIVYKKLQELDDLRKFAEFIEKFLSSKEIHQ